ncbi:MAG: hypothetical protein ACE3L7_05060 [Candidatus Pristimantibacillus sp.]
MFHRYLNQLIEIIYLDSKGCVSQRQIIVRSVNDGKVKAYCNKAKAIRLFIEQNILAVEVVRRAG